MCKPDGGVRGIVVGDIPRRLVAKTMAKQVSKEAEAATAPFHFALSTKAGCDCIAHILQSITDLDPEATVISMDGIGAYDLISRNAMLEGLLRMEKGDQNPSLREMFLWDSVNIFVGRRDGSHPTHPPRGGRGSKATPLMPMLFALGKHPALAAAQERLRGNELLFAYLDDVYAVCRPDRVGAIFAILEQELQAHAEIRLHLGKTQVWNRGGVTPDGVDELRRRARRLKPEAVVWKGDPQLPEEQQGVRVARGAHRSRRARACFLGEEEQGTRDSLSADPLVERPSVCVATPSHVRVDPSKLLVEISAP